VNKINWHEDRWAYACEWPDYNDLKFVQSTQAKCSSVCAYTLGINLYRIFVKLFVILNILR
jgi:hypothetical protein